MARHTYDKVVYEYPVKEIHGKPCKHTNVYFGKNGLSGKVYISRLCNPNTNWTSLQQAQREAFRSAAAYAKAQINDPQKKAAAETRMGTNSRYYTLRSFLMAESLKGNAVE